VLNGRYGPYITDGKRNARIPKDTDPKSVQLELCRELLAAAPPRGSRFGRKKTGPAKTVSPPGAEGATEKPAKKAKGKSAAKAGGDAAAVADAAAKPAPKAPARKKSAPKAAVAKAAKKAPAKTKAK
jgi:DNA topoisomerase-1